MFFSILIGYGKSLVYQMLPFYAGFLLECLENAAAGKPVVVIMSPLLMSVHDQAQKLGQVSGAKPCASFSPIASAAARIDTGHILT